jgi:hypothetical protein
MAEPTLFGSPVGGIVGSRQLIAIQTIDLGRLTHHPVPLVPSALVAVSGTGPGKDSNGSGKTTFLAAVALILGDPEWRLATTGGADALGLLFDPDLSGDAAGMYDPARVGYVVGVFALTTADGNYDELTVWMRVSADDSPRIVARWAPGVHLVDAPEAATPTWNSLGHERQIGPKSFVEQLYGGTGRCLAYVTSRGFRDTDTSLMQLQARLSPDRIGNELIVLLGLEHLIDGERELRSGLANAQQDLDRRIDAHEQREREWRSRLTEIEARDKARAAVAEGRRLWRLRLARRLIDALAERDDLESSLESLATELVDSDTRTQDIEARLTDLPDLAALHTKAGEVEKEWYVADSGRQEARGEVDRLQRELSELASRLQELTTLALTAPAGMTLEEVTNRAEETAEAARTALLLLGAAGEDVRQVSDALEATLEHGDIDTHVREALVDNGIEAPALLDGIVLADNSRAFWEPILASWRAALLVSKSDRDRAVAVSPAGTLLVIAETDGAVLPDGVLEAPSGSERFLHVLAGRSTPPYTDVEAGLVVAGDFEHELCGRDAAVTRARFVLNQAEHGYSTALAGHERADRVHELAVQARDGVSAAVELTALRTEETKLTQRLTSAREVFAESERQWRRADEVRLAANVEVKSSSEDRRWLEEKRAAEAENRTRIEADITARRREVEGLDIDAWTRAWGDSESAARLAMVGENRQEDSLRRMANDQLTSALLHLGIDLDTGEGAPTPPINAAIRARRGLDENLSATNDVRRFDTVTQPIVDWLEAMEEEDLTFRDEVETERRRWDEQITAARDECAKQANLLERHRDMVEQQIESVLEQVSNKYAELDSAAGGHGGRLRWQSVRPESPTDLWVWKVVPEWRRAPGARWLPYTRQANSAMQKQHRTHLVLAALLAAPDPAGRVLIIDEAGNDFGREHLRQVLTAFADVARTHGVTVIAACQDKVLEEVASLGAAGLLLWFERLSDMSPLCKPTRVWGFDGDDQRVELTRPAVEAGRLL